MAQQIQSALRVIQLLKLLTEEERTGYYEDCLRRKAKWQPRLIAKTEAALLISA